MTTGRLPTGRLTKDRLPVGVSARLCVIYVNTMKKGNEHIDFGTQVVKYLSGEMDEAGKKAFEVMVRRDSEKLALLESYRKIWTGVDQMAASSRYNMDSEWSQMSQRIGFSAGTSDAGSDKVPGNDVVPNRDEKLSPGELAASAGSAASGDRSATFRLMFLRVAAAVLIGLVGATIFYTVRQVSMFDQLAVDTGTEVIALPDGSLVTVNAGSSLRYFSDAGLKSRKVMLKGEAFFEVARDTSKPFIIEAGAATIEVLGTSFNVSAYRDSKKVEVQVNSGLVAMSSRRAADNLIILNPGNTGVFDKERQELKLIPAADPNKIAWKTRELVFSGTALSDALTDIGHAYQVEFELENPGLADCPITVSFDNQGLGAVIAVLERMLDLEFSREGDRYFVDGEGCE